MGRKLVIILLGLVSYAQAQHKAFKKSEKLFQKGKYDKSIAAAKKAQSKYKKVADGQYLMAFAYFKKYEAEKKEFLFQKSLNYLASGQKKEGADFYTSDSRFDEIHQALTAKATKMDAEKSNKAKRYHIQLAKIFQDTTIQYMMMFHIKNHQLKTEDTFPPDQVDRKLMLAVAEDLIGVPYKYGGEDTLGFDCSGFVKYVYQQVGTKLPHNAHMMSKLGEEVPREEARIGDLVVFGYRKGDTYRASHAGMVYRTGEDFTVIHCVGGGVKVAQSDWKNHWENQMLFVKRILKD